MTVDIRPLTPDLWPAFEDLFGKQGACYGCWCTYFRLPPAARRGNDRQRNKDPSGRASRPARRRACWPSRTAWPSAGCRSARAPTCRSGTTRAGARRRSIRATQSDPGGLGDLVLLHPHQGARQGPDPPAGRRRARPLPGRTARASSRPARWTSRGFALDRPVRRLDAGVREGRLRRLVERKAGRPLMRYVL